MYINTNVTSLTTQIQLSKSQNSMQTAMNRLSSGLRINSASDDAAGMAIAGRMSAQVTGMNQAARNANDGISLAQTAQGALGEITNSLQRLRELSVQSANATNTSSDRAALQQEASQLLSEIDRVATQTEFNGLKLLEGGFKAQNFQVGANAGQTISVTVNGAKTSQLGTSETSALTARGSEEAINNGDLIINGVSIRGSSASDDLASYPASSKASSAIAKAAAINASTEQTGVSASVDTNSSAGATMKAATGSGKLSINGVETGIISTTTDAATSRAAVVEAINKVSGQTGVTAMDSGDDATGVELQATDGRNITVKYSSPVSGSFDAATTGVRALNDSTLTGASMTGAAGSGVITVNGVDTGVVTTTIDTAATRANVAAAINAISGETGITATDTGKDSDGVTLKAADGRTIDVKLHAMALAGGTSTFTNASTGIGETSGKANIVQGANMTSMAGTGIDPQGTLTAGNVVAAGAITGGTAAANKLVVNGEDLGTMAIGVSGANTFTAAAVYTNGLAAGSSDVKINGHNVTFTATGVQDEDGAALAAAINADTTMDSAGISASYDTTGNKLTFNAADGRAINVATGDGTATNNLTAVNIGYTTTSQASTYTNTFTAGTAVDDGGGFTLATHDININGYNLEFSAVADAVGSGATNQTAIVAAINGDTTLAAAGIVASEAGGEIALTSADGRAITITTGTGTATHATAAMLGFAGGTTVTQLGTFDANEFASDVMAAINNNTTLQDQGVSATLNVDSAGVTVVDAEGETIDFTGTNMTTGQMGLSQMTYTSPGTQGGNVVNGGAVTTTAGSGSAAVGATTIDLEINGVTVSGIETGTANTATATAGLDVKDFSGNGGNGNFVLNGVTVDVAGLTTGANATLLTTNAVAIATAVNTNATLSAAGITASVGGAANSILSFTAADGRAITVGDGTTTATVSTAILATDMNVAATTATTFDPDVMANNIATAINRNADLAAAGTTAALNQDGDGVVLMDAQGDAIDLSGADTTATAAQLGLSQLTFTPNGQADRAEGTEYGSYTLSSDEEIVVSAGTSVTADVGNAGLSSGAYAAQTAYVAAGSNNGHAMAQGDVQINGVTIGASQAGSDTSSRYASSMSADEQTRNTAASAIAKTAAINAVTENTGVTATVNTTVMRGSDMSSGTDGSGALVINGVTTRTVAVVGGGDAINTANSRTAVIDAINAVSEQTGVKAVDNNSIEGGVELQAADGRNINVAYTGGLNAANTGLADVSDTSTVFGTLTAGATATGTVRINGVETGAVAVTNGDNVATANSTVAAINNITDRTGVTASYDSATNKLSLNSAGGQAITVAAGSGIGLSDVGLSASSVNARSNTAFGSYTLSSTTQFDVEKGSTANIENSGLEVGTYGTGKSGMDLSKLDISTAAGAAKAITAIDNALAQVSSNQAALGATQNRFNSTISALQSTSTNLTAARSRIQDADFASETASLSRAQVLQQAGTAMLAQANSSAQGVLSLLR
ncbi:hypothetical protein CCR95_08535 [Thiocystis minor]|uniref:flagellin N-terminal helical domain-containing protein n=1 Tax=Thiocystis minor TaxID=61597 RepID=UPI0019145AE5|nr:flagellin [Thiocystis minor]MBK5964130.1 hypothetical protein [Thiocystis minor]